MEDTIRDITLNANTIITAAAVISAFGVVFAALKKITLFLERQKAQDKELTEAREEIKRLKERLEALERTEEEIKELRSAFADMKEEQTLVCYGLRACLQGLAEQGCDGPVHDAIDKLDKHLNQAAHR